MLIIINIPKPKAANDNGGDRRSESFQPDNYKTEKSYGTSAEYLTSVIARDYPDTLEEMKAGKYRSTRQAAISVGIVKPDERWTAPGPVEKLAALIRKRYSQDQIQTLIHLLEATDRPPKPDHRNLDKIITDFQPAWTLCSKLK